ncbi:hypothetical protein HanPSC8_Chr11g0491401 [Helianthus annuus]|nr:hypothetical protein HanPSC8_Chr11g0491401 [Helianthus annuus]
MDQVQDPTRMLSCPTPGLFSIYVPRFSFELPLPTTPIIHEARFERTHTTSSFELLSPRSMMTQHQGLFQFKKPRKFLRWLCGCWNWYSRKFIHFCSAFVI